MKTPAEVIAYVEQRGIKIVDLKFMDLIGLWQHFQIPAKMLQEETFEDGLYFDGSSIRAWQSIDMSDMVAIPDPSSAKVDPFFSEPTLSLICDIHDPITGEQYSRDPRNVANKALRYLASSGIADTAYFAAEAEFFLFDSVTYDSQPGGAHYFIESQEAPWSSGEESGNMGYRVRPKEGYFPVGPTDSMQNIRNEMILVLEELGIPVERSHHEVAPAQHEINFRFDSLRNSADQVMWFKYVVKNVAARHGKIATFMPKPIFDDNGCGMHTHQSLWKDGRPLFGGDGYAGLSEMALYYIGGILKHARALAAFTNPSTNSYKRLVPGFEAPINLAYSARNRSASVRIPVAATPEARRVEFRCPDPTCNPYLAYTAMLMAGVDGIQNKIHPGEPLDKDIYGLPPEELAQVPQMPGNLSEAMRCLEQDHAFLLKGGVFTEDLIREWISWKREKEISEVESRPSPHEFFLYFDA